MGPPPGSSSSSAVGGGRRWLANLDMYKKVPADLMEGTAQGSVFSYVVLLVILVLIYLETRSYLSYQVVEELTLDTPSLHRKKSLFGGDKFQSISSPDAIIKKLQKIQVKFNITMMDLKCEFATIDVVSVLGAQQNVTKNVQKWMVSAEGVQERYEHQRNLHQADLLLGPVELRDKAVTQSIEELHKNGEDAVNLDPDSLQQALNDYPFVFVDFFANWCSHCRLFAPTWERLAELMVDAKTHHHERVVAEIEFKKEEARRARIALESLGSDGANGPAMTENITYTEDEYQEALQAVRAPLMVAKVDCVHQHQLCRKQSIMSYPTIRLFVNGEIYQDFFGSRTVNNLLQFLVLAEEKVLGKPDPEDETLSLSDHAAVALDAHNVTDEEKAKAMAAERQRSEIWKPSEHPGCQIAGTLYLNKVPGNFYIQAQSATHSLEPTLTNVSHEIHHLYFESQRPPGVKPPRHPDRVLDESQRAQDGTIMVPPPIESSVSSLSHPMNGNTYVTHSFHQAHHHYIKLVSTNLYSYQVVQNSQVVHYRTDQVPEAKFILDLSPVAVTYHASKRHWYDYITSILAIIGGTFTVVGIIDSLLRTAVTTTKHVVQRRRRRTGKQQQNRSLPRPPPQPGAKTAVLNGDPASRPIPVQRHNATTTTSTATSGVVGNGSSLPRPTATNASTTTSATRSSATANATSTITARKPRTPLPRPPGR